MRISIALTLFACAGALLVAAPRSASSMPAALPGHVAKTQELGGPVEKVHRRWRRHRRYGVPRYGYYPYYYRPNYSYYRPYYYRPYHQPYYGSYDRRYFFYRKPRFGIYYSF